jgi:hypothetical protein
MASIGKDSGYSNEELEEAEREEDGKPATAA